MKTDSIQQEILLVTNTTFSNRAFCDKESLESRRNKSHADRLEEACWNGLIDEMLPEISEKLNSGKKLYLWHIRHGNSFLELELGNCPQLIERQTSIDPYVFLSIPRST